MADDRVKIGYSKDGLLFNERYLDAQSVVASNNESAEQHILNTKKHVPETSAANKDKVLTTLANGSIGWVKGAELIGNEPISGELVAGGDQSIEVPQVRNVIASTTDIAVNSALETGQIHLVYE